MKNNEVQKRFDELSAILQKEMNPKGFWTGELSSSALAVAVSIVALHFHDSDSHRSEIEKGLVWLLDHANPDGSFGDTPDSPGNNSTGLLVYAALNLYHTDENVVSLQVKLASWLNDQGINVHSPQIAQFILSHYKKDYTFSVPILTMCGLCNVPGEEAFKYIPQLPFELSLLPRKFYRILNLSVVSYAIPALIAVGIVVFKKKKSNLFWKFVRKLSIQPSLALLERLMPSTGGFLEAIPLTAFVNLSLIKAGYRSSPIVAKGIDFLVKSQREDGSWAIDIDLSTWVTTLSVRSLRSKVSDVLTNDQKKSISKHLLKIQNLQEHTFNGSPPGGWGWTNFSGSVPDGDDTPGVILTLLKLNSKNEVQQPIIAACRWLLKLQNRDGGFPTFSKGWGKLPFDQSSTDLTGHSINAISACLDVYYDDLDVRTQKLFRGSFLKGLSFLQKQQQLNGSWLPLWFGNQSTVNKINPVYGTGKVLTYMKDALKHQWISLETSEKMRSLIDRGEAYLLSVQNEDGSWGGGQLIDGSIEETSLAISALTPKKHESAIDGGLNWLDVYCKKNGLKAAPIGLYFASLWYSEKMYPLTCYLEAVVRKLEDHN